MSKSIKMKREASGSARPYEDLLSFEVKLKVNYSRGRALPLPNPLQWRVSRTPRKLFVPVKPKQNLEPYDYRAVLFTCSSYQQRFTSYKKFQAYTLLPFYIQMNEKWLYGSENFPGLSRNGPQASKPKPPIKPCARFV